MNALVVKGLVKRYARGSWWALPEAPAVDGVDLVVRAGERLGLVGESGSGKTTLVRAALGLLPFEAGRVEVLGKDLGALRGRELRAWRRRFQLLFQDPRAMLNPGLTVRQHLVESATLHRPDEDPGELAALTAERLGLSPRLDAVPRELSGGEQRRVGLGRLLLARPELLVADEPTAGLDAALKADLVDLVVGTPGQRAVVLVSHDLPLVAYACERIAVMHGGRVVETFPVERLGRVHHHPYTRTLLHAAGLIEAPDTLSGEPVGRGAEGCPLVGACPSSLPRCSRERPVLAPTPDGREVACHALETA